MMHIGVESKIVPSVTAEAYPTIPIIFVSSSRGNRLPVHNSMGFDYLQEE
ncbi:MAG: hypothetical protein M1128_01790 [Candidatus Marsarchaeota archaeon]|nr:hypothetical protein [Candidatus Marsarchaeota archaeon]